MNRLKKFNHHQGNKKVKISKLEVFQQQLIKDLLDSFQKVLNWCYEIDDDDSRLPLDVLHNAHQAINSATFMFQPERLKPDLPESDEYWAKVFDCPLDVWIDLKQLLELQRQHRPL